MVKSERSIAIPPTDLLSWVFGLLDYDNNKPVSIILCAGLDTINVLMSLGVDLYRCLEYGAFDIRAAGIEDDQSPH